MTDSGNTLTAQTSPLLARLREGEYDFLDFGCSRGGSIDLAKRLFDANSGLGIDIAQNKIKEAIESGHDALLYDIHELPPRPLVRFCVMAHFLEHVPNRMDVIAFLEKAAAISREFIFIRQPYFDADGLLFQRGLKLYWSDWHGHPNAMTTLNFYSILSQMRSRKRIGNFSIHVGGPVTSSDHSAIHPVDSPRNQHNYDALKHPPKPSGIDFGGQVFTETIVLISKPDQDHYSSFGKVKFDQTIYDSSKVA